MPRHREYAFRMKAAIVIVVYGLLLTACSSNPRIKNYTLANEAPPIQYGSEYELQPGDVLDVKFLYVPELDEEVVIRPDGRLSLPLAHEVMAGGKTSSELTEILQNEYSRELRNPYVTVIVRSFSSQKVYVSGEVEGPTMIGLDGKMTVLQAISEAGGLKDTARIDEVIVIRRNNNIKPEAIAVNLAQVVDGVDTDQDLFLKPQDIVFVPKSSIANVNQWVDQYIRRVLPFDIHYRPF